MIATNGVCGAIQVGPLAPTHRTARPIDRDLAARRRRYRNMVVTGADDVSPTPKGRPTTRVTSGIGRSQITRPFATSQDVLSGVPKVKPTRRLQPEFVPSS